MKYFFSFNICCTDRVLEECWIDRFLDTRKMSKKNPFVYLDVSIDGDPIERMVFEVFFLSLTHIYFRWFCQLAGCSYTSLLYMPFLCYKGKYSL